MKITAKNLNDKWDEIKDLMPRSLYETAAGKLEFAELYDELDDVTKEEYDTWLDKVNEVLEKKQTKEEKKEPKAEPKSEKPSAKPTKKPKTKDSDKPKKPSKPQKEKKDEKPKTSGSKRKKRTSTAKTETKTEKKKDEKPKTQKPTKPAKTTKEKIGEAEPWQYALRRFASMCGKERTVLSIRKYVREIQHTFSAKLGNKTPHIDLIREIQEKLIPKANSTDYKVSIPEWADLKERCRKAAKDKIVSKKVKRPTIVKTALSGLKKKRKSRKRSRR